MLYWIMSMILCQTMRGKNLLGFTLNSKLANIQIIVAEGAENNVVLHVPVLFGYVTFSY